MVPKVESAIHNGRNESRPAQLPESAQVNIQTTLLILFGLGIYFSWIGYRRATRRKVMGSISHGFFAALLFALGFIVLLVGLNIHTYQRLTHEELAATLEFSSSAAGTHALKLSFPDGLEREFLLNGDQWQLDARIIKWQGFANVMGFDSLYRLERISGRYQDIEQEKSAVRSVHALSEDPGLSVWKLAERHQRWLPWIDTQYGSAAYAPITDGARYRAFITQSGVIARPANARAEQAIEQWR